MRSAFDLQLVNGPTGDPALFADVIGAGRAVLIDLGNLSSLSARKLLRVSDVLLSHAHLDHFADFERLLRVVLGRERVIRLTGPKEPSHAWLRGSLLTSGIWPKASARRSPSKSWKYTRTGPGVGRALRLKNASRRRR